MYIYFLIPTLHPMFFSLKQLRLNFVSFLFCYFLSFSTIFVLFYHQYFKVEKSMLMERYKSMKCPSDPPPLPQWGSIEIWMRSLTGRVMKIYVYNPNLSVKMQLLNTNQIFSLLLELVNQL